MKPPVLSQKHLKKKGGYISKREERFKRILKVLKDIKNAIGPTVGA